MNDKIKDILEWIACVIIAVALAIIIRYFLGTPTIVKMHSMYPTLKPNERLVLNRLGRTFKKMPERGDIITFEQPSDTFLDENEYNRNKPIAKYENKKNNIISKFTYNVLEWGKISYIKRVIGLPGDHIEIKDGKVFLNDELFDESNYLDDSVYTDGYGGYVTDIIVPEGYVFAMGDNRTQSADCRRFGCIPLEKIEGKVAIRFWPLNKIGPIKKAK